MQSVRDVVTSLQGYGDKIIKILVNYGFKAM